MALSSEVWEAVLLGPLSLCFTLLFLVPVLTGKSEAGMPVLPLLRQGCFSLLQCKKGSEIQHGYDIMALEGILK